MTVQMHTPGEPTVDDRQALEAHACSLLKTSATLAATFWGTDRKPPWSTPHARYFPQKHVTDVRIDSETFPMPAGDWPAVELVVSFVDQVASTLAPHRVNLYASCYPQYSVVDYVSPDSSAEAAAWVNSRCTKIHRPLFDLLDSAYGIHVEKVHFAEAAWAAECVPLDGTDAFKVAGVLERS